MKNSIDVIKPFAQSLIDESITNVQIIGGVNSVALGHPDTVIDIKNKEVIAPSSLSLPTRRDDGSLRDLDILVLSSDTSEIQKIKDYANTSVGRDLDPSIFGVKSQEAYLSRLNSPLGFTALRTFLSDRYQMDYGMVKSLFPFVVPINPESLETWTLLVDGLRAPIPNPAMSIINYTNRSISGIRHKDASKVEQLASSVFSKAPELRDWAIDGPGADQVELGLIIKSLTPNKKHIDCFGINNAVLTFEKLAEHDSFMVPEMSENAKRHLLGLAALKASGLSYFESNPVIVSLVQKYAERGILRSVVNNE